MLKVSIAAALIASLPLAANATTIIVSATSAENYNAGYGGANVVGEDFEQLGMIKGTPGQVGSTGISTAVGVIKTLGGTGSGGTVSGLPGNTGKELALRNGSVYGRTNITPTGGNWFLDSNDTWGMNWNVGLMDGGAFTKLVFSLKDASDTGAYLRITSGLSSFETRLVGDPKATNGNLKRVEISFGSAVKNAFVILGNYNNAGDTYVLNDGFSIDGLQVTRAPAPVPIPASILLIGTGLAGLAAMKRRKKAA